MDGLPQVGLHILASCQKYARIDAGVGDAEAGGKSVQDKASPAHAIYLLMFVKFFVNESLDDAISDGVISYSR